MGYIDYYNKMLNKGSDIDGHFGYQCWDGYADYCRYLGVPFANCTVTGYAQDIWTQRKTNGTLNYFDEVTNMEQGDIAVFKITPSTPYSHIAMFHADAGGGYGWFFGQNQGGLHTHPNGGSTFNLVKLPYSSTFDTAFRLKKKATKTGNNMVSTKTVNGDLYSGLITVARPEVFWSGGERNTSAIRYIVIHGTATTSVSGAYNTWLRSRNNQTSAHYLVTPNDTMGCVGENFVAWHSGGVANITNANSIGIEHINSSIGNVNDASTYLFDNATLERGAKLTADICKRYGLKPDATTIVPHRQVSATACPQTLNMSWYISRVQHYYNQASGVVNKEVPKAPTPVQPSANSSKPATSTNGKSLEALASEVQRGKWGNGNDRKNRLGKLYNAVQAIVDERAKRIPYQTAHERLKQEVLKGNLGNGTERKMRLGTYYNAIQSLINKR